MRDILILQSHRSPLPYPWIERCMESVREWSALNSYAYEFLGDELFAGVPAELLARTRHRPVIASDLARLLKLQDALKRGFSAVVWVDADFLVFDPDGFVLPDLDCAVGREVWVQREKRGKLKVYKKVHNAFLMFRQGNSLLDFYTDTATRLLARNRGTVPPQFIGPKLLTALHNVALLPVMETAGMLSPMVSRDILRGGGEALDLFIRHSPQAVVAANLCGSSCEKGETTGREMEALIDLLRGQTTVFGTSTPPD